MNSFQAFFLTAFGLAFVVASGEKDNATDMSGRTDTTDPMLLSAATVRDLTALKTDPTPGVRSTARLREH